MKVIIVREDGSERNFDLDRPGVLEAIAELGELKKHGKPYSYFITALSYEAVSALKAQGKKVKEKFVHGQRVRLLKPLSDGRFTIGAGTEGTVGGSEFCKELQDTIYTVRYDRSCELDLETDAIQTSARYLERVPE